MTTETKRDSLPILKDRVSLSPELMKTKTKDKILAIVAILLLTSIVIVTIDFALGLAGLFPNCSLIKSLTHNYTNNNVLIPVNALAHMDPASAIAMCSNPEVQPI